MTENNIDQLVNNRNFKNIYSMDLTNRTSLNREIPNCGSFSDTNDEITAVKSLIHTKPQIDQLYNLLDTEELEQVKTTNKNYKPLKVKVKVNTIINRKWGSLKHIESIDKEKYSIVYNDINKPAFSRDIIYIFINSLCPEYSAYDNEFIKKNIIEFKKNLAFNIDARNIFGTFNYRGIISKTKLQNYLISSSQYDEISTNILADILSDFYGINIVFVVNYLITKNSHYNPNNLVLLLVYKNGKFSSISNNYTCCLFPHEFLELVIANFSEIKETNPVNKLGAISNYKVTDLYKLANLLDIEINQVKEGKEKRKNKTDLYKEIKETIVN